jgi:uncharacterized protein
MSKDANLSQPQHGLLVEKDVDVPMRDGARLKADLFRPDGDGTFPALINIGLYQKDKPWTPPPDLDEKPNPYMNWETVNPEWWVPRGYAALRVDTRGSGKSPGYTAPFSLQESTDFYDAIEWAARQPWCNGRVATIGISYYAQSQWWVANLKPPSLRAMVPWEGRADQYRDATYHGGIFGQGFVTNWFTTHMAHHLLGRAYRNNPDAFQINFLWFLMRHSLDTGAFRPMQAQWDRIEVPFLAAGNWSGSMGQHLRGATEGFMRAASKHKKLRLHAGTHYHAFYSEDGRRDQLRFLDHWLKDIDTGVMDDPPVKLAIRYGNNAFEWRHEDEWPIARTQWTRLYFDLGSTGEMPDGIHGRLVQEPPARLGSRTYPASGATRAGHASSSSTSLAMGLARSGISLQTEPFPEDTEITGPLAAVLWVSSDSEDMDLFLTIRNIDADGNDVFEDGQQGQPIPVTKGWLRASHRELDPELSLPYRPYHRHLERKELEPGEIVRLDVEIWPTSMVFKKGHRLRLDVQPRDGIGSAPFTHYHADYNSGANTVHSGPGRESYLLIPVIPPR